MISRLRLLVVPFTALGVLVGCLPGALGSGDRSAYVRPDRVAAAAPEVQTLATTRRRIVDFAQDGNHIAWSEFKFNALTYTDPDVLDCRPTLRIRRLRPLTETPISLQPETCAAGTLALGSSRAVWSHFYGGAGQHYWQIKTAIRGSRSSQVLEELIQDEYPGRGDVLAATAGDGDVVLYSVLELNTVDPNSDESPLRLGAGRVMRVGKGLVLRLPSAVLMAIHQNRVALVRPDATDVRSRPRPSARVEVWSLDGRRRGWFAAQRAVQAVALWRSTIAVITSGSDRRMLEIHRLNHRGAKSVSLPQGTAPEISMSGSTAVFHDSSLIYALDVETLKRRVLAQAAGPPIGLSIEGARAAWAENLRGPARVRAVFLRSN